MSINSPNPYLPFVNPYTTPVSPMPQMAPVSANPTTIMAWVQGEQGALSYPLSPNTRAYLFDMTEERFFVKVSDITGVIQPLRPFKYYEETAADPAPVPVETSVQEEVPNYVTREELEKALAGLRNNNYKKGDTHHGKQAIRGTSESGNDESVR